MILLSFCPCYVHLVHLVLLHGDHSVNIKQKACYIYVMNVYNGNYRGLNTTLCFSNLNNYIQEEFIPPHVPILGAAETILHYFTLLFNCCAPF